MFLYDILICFILERTVKSIHNGYVDAWLSKVSESDRLKVIWRTIVDLEIFLSIRCIMIIEEHVRGKSIIMVF